MNLPFLSIFFLLIFVTACQPKGALVYSEHPATQTGFASVKSSILGPQCVQCHAWANSEDEIRRRVMPGEPEQSSLYQYVADGRMPQGGPELDTAQLEIIRDYINSLVDVPTPVPTPTPTPTPVPVPSSGSPSFATISRDILVPKCSACHSWTRNEAKLISLYVVKGKPQSSRLWESVNSNSMPRNAKPLSGAEVEEIADYIRGLK